MTIDSHAEPTKPTPLGRSGAATSLAAMMGRQGSMLTAKDVSTGMYWYVSEGLAEMLGLTQAHFVGSTDADVFEAPLAMVLRAADQTATANESPTVQDHKFEFRGQRHEVQVVRMLDGHALDGTRCLWSAWTNLLPQRQKEIQLKLALEQLEQQQRSNDALRSELSDQALRDGPTGLYKRPHFEDQLRREVDLTNREHREFALVLIRVDPLNAKCLAFGDAAQVRIQEAMGRLLRSNTRAMDVSSRLEDNLFAVLLSGVGLATAHSRMEGLRRQAAAQIVLLDGNELGFSVSMGVASYPHTAQSIEALQAACEQAIGDAQARGGNRLAMASIRLAEQPAG